MAYSGTSTYGATQHSTSEEPGYERRPSTLAVDTGDNIPPNTTNTKKPELNTRASTPALGADVKVKRDAMARSKVAYILGFNLGKAAAYPLTMDQPQGMPNIVPPEVPPMKAPKISSPTSKTHQINNQAKQPKA